MASSKSVSASIKTKAARSRLAPRREPYWSVLSKGLAVGYRQSSIAAQGSWIARMRDPSGSGHKYRALAGVSEYDEAAQAAWDWSKSVSQDGSSKAVTVKKACDKYVEALRINKGDASADDAAARFRLHVDDRPIGSLTLDKLRVAHVMEWRDSFVKKSDDPEVVRRSKDTANRYLTALKAALNHAYKMQLCASDAAWRAVGRFEKVGGSRKGVLAMSQREALLDSSGGDFAAFCKGLLLTGARPGELSKAQAQHFDAAAGTLWLSGKTGPRVVPLSTAACAFFRTVAKGKIGAALLFERADGLPWIKDRWKYAFEKAARTAGLPAGTVLYILRHTFITASLESGIDPYFVARATGTSLAMIEKTYGQESVMSARTMLDKAAML
jgi:integrase